MIKQDDVIKVLDILEKTYPDAECALNHKNVYELIVAVALSAQTTDKSVNQVSPALFERYPDAEALAAAEPSEVEEYIKRIGMYRNTEHMRINGNSLLSKPYRKNNIGGLAADTRKTYE